MQFKPVPEPPDDFETLEAILEAVPTEAGVVDDCCRHLLEETRLDARNEAEAWLVFLRALELVTEEPAGYRRCSSAKGVSDDTALDSDRLQQAFRDRVYGANSVLERLERAETPRSTEDVVAELRQQSTVFDGRSDTRRNRFDDGVRVHRLLEWATLLGLGERTDDGQYR
ncbi:hypothetical protein [Natronorubrum texcoconense]|uniref:Uncharacterized protein n=1 Tax=Natronorubrum texcoconense TaxID=1095776 RepID=A0A1G8VMT7_9EURY|nr:hypothetical protein [Natronorubrum texcoconense]SDJ66725.1 hypothetical protein SAMN04515672_1391 [Natronorubrum texcoconense]